MRRTTRRKLDYKKMEKQLTALEQRLVRGLHRKLRDVRNASTGNPTELLDVVAEGELDYMSALSVEAGSATIDEVHQAIEKLHEGTYGVCDACGRPITKRRLKARPFAVLCLACKEVQERRGHAVQRAGAARLADGVVAVNLNDEDPDAGESAMGELFRGAQEFEISEMF